MGSRDMKVRDMTEEDIDSVLKIEEKSFKTPWTREAFEMEMTKNKLAKYIVAENSKEVVGYAGMWLITDEIHITNIAVDPKHRGQGIGDMLVDEITRICKDKKMRAITLEVRKSNEPARSLYEKHGFEEAGVRPGYYTDTKEDAIIMWKTIENKI